MSRTSPYAIRLSSAELAQLEKRAGKYTLPYFQVQRAKMILLAAEGLANDQIATNQGSTIACRRSLRAVERTSALLSKFLTLFSGPKAYERAQQELSRRERRWWDRSRREARRLQG